jgi:hypothetical protein
MSSISGVNHPYGSSTSDQHSQFPFHYPDYSNEGPSSSSATFTINPASSRPPSISLKTRTPRTSLVGSHAERPTSAFEMSNYGEPAINEKEALEASSPTAESNSKPVRIIEVWRELFLTSTGRDKALVRTSTMAYQREIDTFTETAPVLHKALSLIPPSLDDILCSSIQETMGGGHDYRLREGLLWSIAFTVWPHHI